MTSGTSNGKGVSTKSSGGSLLDWAATGGSGLGGKKGSDADDGRSGSEGAVDRNKMLQEKVRSVWLEVFLSGGRGCAFHNLERHFWFI